MLVDVPWKCKEGNMGNNLCDRNGVSSEGVSSEKNEDEKEKENGSVKRFHVQRLRLGELRQTPYFVVLYRVNKRKGYMGV